MAVVRRAEQPSNSSLSIADPTLAGLFTPAAWSDIAGVTVGETSSLGLSAVYRGGLSWSPAPWRALPFNSWRTPAAAASRCRASSTTRTRTGRRFEWKEPAFAHLVLHGKAGALKVRTEAGGLAALPLVHPSCFTVIQPTMTTTAPARCPPGASGSTSRWPTARRSARRTTSGTCPRPGDGGKVGIRACSPTPGMSLATSIAGDKAAGKVSSPPAR
jgi:hypothetical protein